MHPHATKLHPRFFTLLTALVAVAWPAAAQIATADIDNTALRTGIASGTSTFPARDRPFPAEAIAKTPQARTLLQTVAWEPADFDVTVHPPTRPPTHPPTPGSDDRAPVILTFPSARPAGSPARDRVRITWHPAVAPDDAPAALNDRATHAPAVVLIHSLHPQMLIARALGPTIARQGVHAFVVELPGYGSRRASGDRWPGVEVVAHATQAVADVRRACDAVAALPGIDPERLVLQGSSLGTFPAAVATELGAQCSSLVLFLGGANIVDVLEHGKKDAANLRASLERQGIDADDRRALLTPLEPLHLADQLDPQRTWLLTAKFDEVIHPRHTDALAQAIGLDDRHHRKLPGNHYTASFALPAVAQFIADVAWERDPLPAPVTP